LVRGTGGRPQAGRWQGRHHYRLYCLLDYDAANAAKSLLVIVTRLSKPARSTLSRRDYALVRGLGAEYRRRNPRSLA
jgi:hypothetical protein